MDKINTYQRIARLIYKQQTARLNKKETKTITDWLTENDAHKELYDKLTTKEYIKDIEFYDDINTSAAWEKYTKKYPQKPKRKTIAAWVLAAACLTGIIVLSVIFTKNPENKNVSQLTAIIQPGSSKAILILNNGKSVDLTSTENNRIITSEYTEANNTGSQISYTGEENSMFSSVEEDVFNEIVIPRGGEYKIILSDGTTVWLNSQTKLKYPVKFTQNTRNVYLEGEAFFEVAKNTDKPFFVHLNNSIEVKVLGTSFNVRAYPDEETAETVLEEGSVNVQSAEGNSTTLQPSFMAQYNIITKTLSEKKVDTELYTAWKDGRYVFYNESVENILHKLSRWYNIDILFKDEAVKRLTFNGNVKKYENVNTLLEAFETSGGIHFETDGKRVIVSSSTKNK